MPCRRALAGAAGTLLFLLGVTVAAAQPPTTTTTADSTTTTSTSTVSTTSAVATTILDTTTVATTTRATTTATTTKVATTAPTTTVARTTRTATRRAPARSTRTKTAQASPAQTVSLTHGCQVLAVVLLLPNRRPLAVGSWSRGTGGTEATRDLRYPAGGSAVASGPAVRRESTCSGTAEVTLSSVSLFSGLVSAQRVTLALSRSTTATIAGLTVEGRRVVPRRGRRVLLGRWGYLVTNPVTRHGLASALAIHLLAAHDGLPAGTVVLLAAASQRRVAAKRSGARRPRRTRHAASHAPLKVTPPLALRRYIFPVAGQSDYIDTYGAFRSDVPGNWHHGDDIFADLGTPVVAVASGTINRVGWEKLGGWRLWVRDPYGDEFYYAHLAGYAPSDLRSNVVHAGQVIGFIGNTGDAFTTSPHLHFEIHPRHFLHLGYDGAVDPTSYLEHWTHLAHVHAPKPVHPAFPATPALEREAHYVFRELLAARHLIPRAPKSSARPHVTVPKDANGPALSLPRAERAAAGDSPVRGKASLFTAWFVLVLAVLAAVGLGGCALLWRRRRASA